MASPPKRYYTPEEYLALERAAEYKSEYVGGEIFAMTGTSVDHNTIAGNILRTFRSFSGWVHRNQAQSAVDIDREPQQF